MLVGSDITRRHSVIENSIIFWLFQTFYPLFLNVSQKSKSILYLCPLDSFVQHWIVISYGFLQLSPSATNRNFLGSQYMLFSITKIFCLRPILGDHIKKRKQNTRRLRKTIARVHQLIWRNSWMEGCLPHIVWDK